MNKLRILLADDHMVVREGLKALIDEQPDMEVVGEAADGEAACRMVGETHPNLVIMDVAMPVLNGLEATERLKHDHPEVKVLVLSVHDDVSYLRRLLAAGASGYLLKQTLADALIQAIRMVAAGGVYLEPVLAEYVVGRHARGLAAPPLGDELSEREIEVVQLIAQGYSNKDVATQLGLSVKTVETYRTRACEKLGLSTRAALVRYALVRGWLHAP